MSSALDRLMNKNLPKGGVRKKTNTARRRTNSKAKKQQEAESSSASDKRAYQPSDEVKELEQKVLERKQELAEAKNAKGPGKKASLLKKKSDYEGFDTTGLTPGLAPVGFEDESDSEDEKK